MAEISFVTHAFANLASEVLGWRDVRSFAYYFHYAGGKFHSREQGFVQSEIWGGTEERRLDSICVEKR